MASIPHVPLAAEPITSIVGISVTNAQINATIALVVFLLIGFVLRLRLKERPGRFQAACEMIVERLLGFFDGITGDRKKSKRFFPITGSLFLFILLSNWMGLLPGTGSIGFWQVHGGEPVLVPLFRPANSDLNLTLAMAFVTVFASHIAGIHAWGVWTHLNKFLQIGPLFTALRTFHPVKILVGAVQFVVGIIEMFSEVAKLASLSLRLFGNIFAGEVLITVISALFAFVAPLPFMGLEVIVGAVQATVFAVLATVYMTLLTAAPHGESHHESGQPAHG